MATLLNRVRPHRRRFVGAALVLGLLLPLAGHGAVTLAGTYTAPWTGYAWGNRNGADGNYLDTPGFADHQYGSCGDPSANWSWGTDVYPQNPNNVSSPIMYLTYLVLEDSGDPYCNEPHYWADVYFGRYEKSSSENCSCPGSPSPGYCSVYSGDDGCQDATQHGAPTYTYTGP